MEQIQLSNNAFLMAISEAIEIGRNEERMRVLKSLTEDALIQIGLDAKVLTYLVEMLEL